MNYSQTIEYMYSRLPMFSRTGSDAIKSGLDNIIALSHHLGNPHTKTKFIHIAGTNGKGSVSHMLAAILQSAGYKTGLYTSPHLKDFRERIKIDGQMIGENEVVSFIEKIKPIIERTAPSFFEITVAMAFHHFEQHHIDVAVIETGLGGRLDSTNIITPQLSVITNIGYDHVQILGDTLAKIAYEKAGIIKPFIPVIIGEKHPESLPVFLDKAAEMHAPIYFAEDEYKITQWNYENQMLSVQVATKEEHPEKAKYLLDLTAQYQTKNLLTVLASCRRLRQLGYNISESRVTVGLQHTQQRTGLQGRWQIIQQNPKVVLDVAHNPHGVTELLKQLQHTPHRQLHIVLGMVKDKDVDAVLAMLPSHATYYFTHANIPRALPATELKEKAATHTLTGTTFENVNHAIAQATAQAQPTDLILVCGSVFLVGEVIM